MMDAIEALRTCRHGKSGQVLLEAGTRPFLTLCTNCGAYHYADETEWRTPILLRDLFAAADKA